VLAAIRKKDGAGARREMRKHLQDMATFAPRRRRIAAEE